MSEMVERVADTIIATMFAEHEIPVPDDLRAKYLATARAAIAAMRESTDAMYEAGKRSDALNWSPEEGEGLDSFSVDVVWRAMIDAALK